MLNVEALGQLLDLLGLVLEGLTTPAVFLQDPELAACFQRRRDDHACGVVPGSARVVADPDRAIAKWPWVVRVVVRPQRQIRIASLQIRQAERALRAVDEFAHEQLLERVLVVLQLELLEVEQITAPSDCVEDGNDLAPLAVRAQRAAGDLLCTRPWVFGFLALAVAEFLATPERIGLVRHRAGCREVGFAPLLVGRHRRGDGVQLLEILNPEIFVDVDVPMMALGGTAVGAQKAQLSPRLAVFAEHDRVAGQLQAKPFLGKGDDVAAEDLRLSSAGREENLVFASQHRIHERFAGEIVGQADLPTFQDVADPRRQGVLLRGEQLLLIGVHLADELVEKVDFGQLADVVLDLLFPLAPTLAATVRPLPTVAPFITSSLAWLICVLGNGRGGGGFSALFNEPFAHGRQTVELVQLAFGQRRVLFQQQRDASADCSQWLLIAQHVFPAALADPVIDDADVRQVEVRLDFLRLVAAQEQAFGGFFNFVGVVHGPQSMRRN